MNELQIFNNPEFGQVRTIIKDNEIWFVGKDVAEALGYSDTNQAIRKHIDEEDKLTRQIDGIGQKREMYIINESGLYSLVFSSKLPTAKEFKRWVTSEVLPSIRKTGTYSIQEVSPLKALNEIGQSINLTIETLNEQARRMKNIEIVAKVQNNRIGDIERKMQLIQDIETINCDNWRTHIRPLINQIAKYIPVLDNKDRFSAAWQESYRRLEQKYDCNLKSRLKHLKERLRVAGVTKKVIDNANNLDVIGNDKRLIECYIAILKHMILEYKRVA